MSATPIPFAYCLNVHRADTLDDVLRAIREGVLSIRDLVAPDRPVPVGLYLSDTAARELDASPDRLDAFRALLDDTRLSVRMVNASLPTAIAAELSWGLAATRLDRR